MTSSANRTPEQIRSDLESEREQLASAVEHLRDELGQATNIAGKLPVLAAGAASAGFVLAGGLGATVRLLTRAAAARRRSRRAPAAGRSGAAEHPSNPPRRRDARRHMSPQLYGAWHRSGVRERSRRSPCVQGKRL